MIVLCPSCSTRYRHEPAAQAAVGAAVAECSRCDEQFPLRPARRTYVMVPGSGRKASVPSHAAAAAGRPALAARAPAASDFARPSILGLEAHESGSGRDRVHEGETPARAPRSVVVEFLIALAPPCVGASLAYQLAQRGQMDPVAWSALGGALGFLLGWGCLLWLRRND